jgi:siroheme synthase
MLDGGGEEIFAARKKSIRARAVPTLSAFAPCHSMANIPTASLEVSA